MVLVRAPANVALVKYMGKTDFSVNLPANPSLSLTLQDLCTVARVTRTDASGHGCTWNQEFAERLEITTKSGTLKANPPVMSEKAIARVIKHSERVKDLVPGIFLRHGLTPGSVAGLEISAANTFPASSGIASSASSFAAVTLGVAAACAGSLEAFEKAYQSRSFREDLAAISREGSGSSCRSFDGPWVVWSGAHATKVDSEMPALADIVVLVSSAAKDVSSSEAHKRTPTSFFWEGRPERAANRVHALSSALQNGDLAAVSRIAWDDFWDMHSMFHTAWPPFSYFEPGTIDVLKWAMSFASSVAAPVVTMDAGANVHLIVPEAQSGLWIERIASTFPQYRLLVDTQGAGASIIEGES